MEYIKEHYQQYEYNSKVLIFTLWKSNKTQNLAPLSRPLEYFKDNINDLKYIDIVKLMEDFTSNVKKITEIDYKISNKHTNLCEREFDPSNYLQITNHKTYKTQVVQYSEIYNIVCKNDLPCTNKSYHE